MEPLVSEWSIRILHSRKRNVFNVPLEDKAIIHKKVGRAHL